MVGKSLKKMVACICITHICCIYYRLSVAFYLGNLPFIL